MLGRLMKEREGLVRVIQDLRVMVQSGERAEVAGMYYYIERLKLNDKIEAAQSATPPQPIMLQWINWPGNFEQVASEKKSKGMYIPAPMKVFG